MERRCLNCFNVFKLIEGHESEAHVCPYCGFLEFTEPKEPYHLKPGVILFGRYIIGTVLGYGGFGIIYKAWDNVLGNVIAIKEYYPTGLVQRVPGEKIVIVYEGSRKKEYISGLQRFLDEARNMAKFSNNNNIVRVENFFEENNTAYLVMEYLDGMSLKEYLKQENGRIDINIAVEIISSIADALQEMHNQNILHRDISPDNIFLCTEGKIKLIDFGAARFSSTEEVTRSIILKPGYAPPEQYQSKSKQGPWTDIYALSATLYRAITGIVPDESVNRVIVDEVLSPNEIDPEIPDNLSNTIMKGMALNHELRFKDIDEFKKALNSHIKVLEPKKELKQRKKKRVVTIAIVAALLAVTGVFVWNIYRSKKAEVILEAAKVVIWVAKEGEQSDEDLKVMYEEAAEELNNNQPNIEIEWVFVNKDDYEEKLSDAYLNGEMPTIYDAAYASEEILNSAASLNQTFEYLNSDECYLIAENEEEIINSNKMPLSFKAPVVYIIRKRADTNGAKFELSEATYDEIKAGECYVASGCEEMYSSLISNFDASEIENNTVEGIYRILTEGDAEVAYYLASTDEYMEVQSFEDENGQTLSGRYEVCAVNVNEITVCFTNEFSIAGGASEKEFKAASMLFAYLLEQGAQEKMFISGNSYELETGEWLQVKNNGLPLNEAAFKNYINTNSDMEILNDYLKNMNVIF